MNERDPQTPAEQTPEIVVNEYGATRDSAVVVDEADRTVLLTPDETVVIEKEPAIDIVPRNRPRKVNLGIWGQTELATVFVGVLAIVAVLLIYFFLVVPSDRELERNRAERDKLDRDLGAATARYGSITDTESHVASLIKSVDDFQLSYLPAAENGRYSLYQRINGLIASNGLVNTSGPDYAPLEAADQGSAQDAGESERGKAKFRSLFPGVYVTMTVEGPYQNLRRFIREIETGREFVIISSIKLEPSDNQRQTPTGATQGPMQTSSGMDVANPTLAPSQPFATTSAPQRPRGKTHGEVVSLRIEMAAYFRRPVLEPTAQ
ncbi:MAG: GspMb/PilO family protein [Pyrinomonadaceae bacterium]